MDAYYTPDFTVFAFSAKMLIIEPVLPCILEEWISKNIPAKYRQNIRKNVRDFLKPSELQIFEAVVCTREIGSGVGRNQTTVMRICDCWMQEGTTDRRGRSHPPQCTTSREDKQIVRMAVTDHSVTSRTITQHIVSVTHHSVSARTIRHRLQQSGLSARCPLLGLPLTQNHRRLRLQLCD
ncbi:transposable element Tcb1 transposase [Trichonephila clavipes]|nr:transposable element Tcb1 transposase [Trichonephila clavipes]